jgi:predicted CXXCH cytochrome family protein
MKNQIISCILLTIALVLPNNINGQSVVAPVICVDCHKKINNKSFLHKPSKEDCKTCHLSNGKPHPSDDQEGFELSAETPKLCYSCHIPPDSKLTLHPPFKKGQCLECHEVHSSNNKKLVFAAPPDLCFFCHSDLEKRLDTAKSIHEVIRTGTSCVSCHSPHQSSQPKLLASLEKELCLKCHDKIITKGQRNISNIKNELERNKYVHGAIIKNGCSVCHEPHAAEQNSLLKELFTSGSYVYGRSKDSIALCFKCHSPALLEKEKDPGATSFRNENKNMHFKHIYKAKGRNCTNCHGVHSGPNEFLLVDNVKFGRWSMVMKFTKTEDGGKCITACHAPKSYSRSTPTK